jgi:hypothetical protein
MTLNRLDWSGAQREIRIERWLWCNPARETLLASFFCALWGSLSLRCPGSLGGLWLLPVVHGADLGSRSWWSGVWRERAVPCKGLVGGD